MKLSVKIMVFLLSAVVVTACKTPSKDGTSLSSLSIGNVKACERTKDRIKEAYEQKELRSLAEKGHRYLIQEIAKGNQAAMITEAALRISTFKKGGDLYAQLVNKIFSDGGTEADLAEFAKKYQGSNGMREAVEVLRTAQRGVIAQYMAEVQASAGSKNGADVSARADAAEIVREITDWSNEMSSRFSAKEGAAAEGQPALRAEAEAVRAVVDTVLAEFQRGNQKLAQANIAGLAEVEVAQLELAKANTDIAEGYKQSNPEQKVAEVFRKYGNSKNVEVRQAVAIQAIHMLKTTSLTRTAIGEYTTQVKNLLGESGQSAASRFKVAEMASLEGLIEVAEQSGQTNRANELKAELSRAVESVTRELGIRGTYNVNEATSRKSSIDLLVKEIGNLRKFESSSELSYYRGFYRRIAESARRGRERK